MNFFKKIKWKKILNNLFLGILITFIFFIFYWIALPRNFNFSNLLHRDNLLIVFFIILIGTFLTYSFRIFYYIFLLFLIYLEYLHIVYYGNSIFPIEIWIFFTEYVEISQAIGTDMLILFIKPTIVFIISLIMVLFVIKVFNKKVLSNIIINVFFIFIIIAWPTSLYVFKRSLGSNPPNDQHILRSGLETFNLFLGVTLPKKIFMHEYDFTKIKKTPKPSFSYNNNIVFLLGESLAANNMQSFGYKINTTPRIVNKLEAGKLHQRLCLAGGACTRTSLSAFFNLQDSIGNIEQIISQKTSLFKLAKQNGYTTYFISAQSSEGLSDFYNFLGSKYIDYYKRANDIITTLSNNESAYDSVLFYELKNIDLSKGKNFIVLHMYGSHENYKNRVPDNERVFKPKDYKIGKIAHYNNSVLYTDKIISKILDYLYSRKENIEFIFTSDHGENVNPAGYFGHCSYSREISQVPFLYSNINTENKIRSFPQLISHYDVSILISNLLGYNIKKIQRNYSFFNLMELDGSAGYVKIFHNDSIVTNFKRY